MGRTSNVVGSLDQPIHLGCNRKARFQSDLVLFRKNVDERANNGATTGGDGKNLFEAGQMITSNLYLCLGEHGQDKLHNRKSHLDLATTRYPRILDEFE